jgi:coenzyme F420-reducing hydrogenase alpha subunit
MNNNWKYMNSMPALFRRKTSPELEKVNEEIIAKVKSKEYQTVSRSQVEAIDYATKTNHYHKLCQEQYREGHFSTVSGYGYMSAKNARKYYIDLCRTMDAELAARVLTLWQDNKWIQLCDLPDETL